MRVPVPTANEAIARAAFNEGIEQKMGILFATVCTMDDITCCHVWIPADEDEAERFLMLRDLKFSANTGESRFFGKAVKNRMVWFWLKLKYRKCQVFKDSLFSGWQQKLSAVRLKPDFKIVFECSPGSSCRAIFGRAWRR